MEIVSCGKNSKSNLKINDCVLVKEDEGTISQRKRTNKELLMNRKQWLKKGFGHDQSK